MIKPTVGRVVLFRPASNQQTAGFTPTRECAALICYVHSDTMVNLAVFDGNGVQHPCTSVTLIQDGEAEPENGYFAYWMPYQKKVAAGEIPPVLHAT